MVFQNPDATLNPAYTVGRQIERPPSVNSGTSPKAGRPAQEALRLLKGGPPRVQAYYDRYPSAAQRRREAAGGHRPGPWPPGPDLVICDELGLGARCVGPGGRAQSAFGDSTGPSAPPSSSSPTTSPWSDSSPTTWPSCTWARSWRWAPRKPSTPRPTTHTPRPCCRRCPSPTRRPSRSRSA